MVSLRLKLIVTLVSVSCISIAVVAGTSRYLLQQRFNEMIFDRALGDFTDSVIQYHDHYGSWEAARAAQTLLEFNRDRRLTEQARPAGGPLSSRPASANAIPGPGVLAPGATPLPFVVTDAAGAVLLPLGGHAVGERLAPAEMAYRAELRNGEELLGYVSIQELPALTLAEQRYLAEFDQSWWISLAIAGLVALPFGILLGNKLSAPLEQLTRAIEAMKPGQLRQKVPVASNDELGRLSSSFNHMSEELAQTYTALENSNRKLDEYSQQMRELSERDELTHLLNRRAFNARIELLAAQARRYEHPITLAMIDVDHFKKVNDQYSHAIGDRVLQVIASILRSHLRDADLLARYGGEEFVIAFPETDPEQATMLADRLRGLVVTHSWISVAPDLNVTLSIGLAELKSGITIPQAMRIADANLYEAKRSGRNRIAA